MSFILTGCTVIDPNKITGWQTVRSTGKQLSMYMHMAIFSFSLILTDIHVYVFQTEYLLSIQWKSICRAVLLDISSDWWRCFCVRLVCWTFRPVWCHVLCSDWLQNKSAFLCGVMKTYRQREKQGNKVQESTKGPDEVKIKVRQLFMTHTEPSTAVFKTSAYLCILIYGHFCDLYIRKRISNLVFMIPDANS